MKSPGRALARALRNKTPVPMSAGTRYNRGLSFNLGAGRGDRETMMRQYGISGTVYGIVGLLAETAATPAWKLYRKQPVDGRRRYTTGDQGSDQRTEVVQHAAIQLLNSPNDFHSRFEYFEGSQQHQELTGETFWVLDMEAGFPTSMWYVRPDRMEPVPDPDNYLIGWYYTGPDGSTTPLKTDEVILEKRPDPLDPYRGAGPVASNLPNIQQQRYATEYQRNLFLNGADPGGVITVPNRLSEPDFDELIDRWRESHRGVARAGHVGVLEDGATWAPNAHTNKDMEYGQLRLANRDELREAWRIHKTMMGTADDVNRANAVTAQEVFVDWQLLPRLNRRRDTLNSKLLPLFARADKSVEFDYQDPSPTNAEAAALELAEKTKAWLNLVQGGADPHDALKTVGLPDMKMTETATQSPALPPARVPAGPDAQNHARPSITVHRPRAQTPQPDLQAVDEQWRDATAQLDTRYNRQVLPAQRRQLADQIRNAVDTGNLDSLASLTTDPSALAALIFTAMSAYAVTAARQAAAELTAQGAPAQPAAADPAQLRQIADAAATLLTATLALAAGREALRLAHAGQSGAQVADGVARYLAALSGAAARTQLSGAMSAAQNKARLATFTAPGAPRCELLATEMHDKNTCAACDLIDGHSFGYSDDPDAVDAAHAAYPVGGYVQCEGRERCRGTLHAVVQAPVRAKGGAPLPTLPEAPRMAAADLRPLADFLRHQLGAPLNGHANGHREGASR